MIEPTRIQTIYQSGLPAFVVLPFVDFASEHPKEAEAIKAARQWIPAYLTPWYRLTSTRR
jgi:hypothetical protein